MRRTYLIAAVLGAFFVGHVAMAVTEATLKAAIETEYAKSWHVAWKDGKAARQAAQVLAKVMSDEIPSTDAGDNRLWRQVVHPTHCSNTTTGSGPWVGFDLPDAATNTCWFLWLVPDDWYAAGDAFIVTPLMHLQAAGSAGQDVVLDLCIDSGADNQDVNTCDVQDTGTAWGVGAAYKADDLWRAASWTVTGAALTHGLAPGTAVPIRVRRLGADASDDWTNTMDFGGLEIRYTTVPYGS